MNLKTTIVLVILAALAGVWLWKGDDLRPTLGLKPVRQTTDPPALTDLERDFAPRPPEPGAPPDPRARPAHVTHIEVAGPGGTLVLNRTPDGWTQPGNWPLRTVEVDELLEALAALGSVRFQPIALPDGADLKQYGLAPEQKPVTVKVTANGKPYTLVFGEPALKEGEVAFARSAYVRVNDAKEVLRLGPNVMPVLQRTPEAYYRRQLFSDTDRVKLAGEPPPFAPPGAPRTAPAAVLNIPSDGITEVRVSGPSAGAPGTAQWPGSGTFTLKRLGPNPEPTRTDKDAEPAVQPDRLAERWAVEVPVRDKLGKPLPPVRERADPVSLRRVLAAVPELWVEDFVPAGKMSLDNPEKSLTVVTRAGPVTVKFGGVAKVVERDESITVPGPPGLPPQTIPRKVMVEYRYAQLEGNPQVFTLPGDKIDELFVKAGAMADSRLVPVGPDDVHAVTIAQPGKPPVTFTRKKGAGPSFPGAPPGFGDRWLIDEKPNAVLADPTTVRELLDRLLMVRSTPDSDLYRIDPKARGLDPANCVTITLVAREKRPEGEPDAPPREYKVYVGAADLGAGKLPLQLAGWPRVALVPERIGGPAEWLTAALFPERLTTFLTRPAFEYRDPKVIDSGESRPSAVTVTGETGTFAIKLEKGADGREAWKLNSPLVYDTDTIAVQTVIGAIDQLRATKFVAGSAPNPAEYGLDKPRLTATIGFEDGRTFKLEIGKAAPPAKRSGPPVKKDDPFGVSSRQPFPPGFPQPKFPPPGGPDPTPPDQPEVFARLDGGAVFRIPTAAVDAMTAGLATATPGAANVGALRLLPRQVWMVQVQLVTGAEISRGDNPAESFSLAKDNNDWKLTGAFTAPVPFLNAQPMLTGLGFLTAARYEALSAPDPAKYGFDRPVSRVKLSYTELTATGPKPVTKVVVIGAPVVVSRSPDAELSDAARAVVRGIAGGAGAPIGDAASAVATGARGPETFNFTERYARLDEPNAPVFVVPAAYVALAQSPPLALPERNLLFVETARVTRLQITGTKPENNVTLAKTPGGWKAEGDSFAIDADVVRGLVVRLAPLPIEKLAAYGEAVKWADFGLDNPEWTLTITLSGEKPETKKIQFGKADPSGGRYVRVNDGPAVGVVPASAVPAFAHAKLEFVERTLLTFDPDKFLGLDRVRGKEQLELAPGAGTSWDVVKPAKQKADQQLVEELADALKRLRAEKIVAVGKAADVFKTYGLEPPEATVTLTVGDPPEMKVLRIGALVDPARPDGDRYVALESGTPDAVVGVLPAAMANKLLAPAVSFRDRTLAKFVDADRLVLERGTRKVTFTKVGGVWKVTEPLMADVSSATLDDLVNDLAKLRAADWVADAPTDLKPYGLDAPEAVWTVSQGDKVVLVLRVGKTGPDGRAFATVGTGGSVAVLGKEQTARVLAEYRNRIVWPLSAEPATTVEITVGDKPFTLNRGDTGWTDPAAPADTISGPAVVELLNGLAALSVERYAADANADLKAFGLDKPFATVTVTLKTGEKRVLAVGGPVPGTDGKQRFARVIDKGRTDVFVLSAPDTALLTRPRAEYLQKK